MNSVGKILKEERISRSITLSEVSLELRIQLRTLQDIEEDKIINDHDMVFLIGHVRSYCEFLKIDSKLIVSKFKNQYSFKKEDLARDIPKPAFMVNYSILSKTIPTTLIILIFSTFYLLFVKTDNHEREYALIPDIPENSIPIIEKSNTISLTNYNLENKSKSLDIEKNFASSSVVASVNIDSDKLKGNVTLKILKPTWIQLRDSSQKIVFSRLMDENEEYSYAINSQYNLTAGNAGNILVLIDNNLRGRIGKLGEVVDSLIIDNSFKK